MITYKYLSKALKCHVNVAKQMLYNFVQQQQEKGNKDLGEYLISIVAALKRMSVRPFMQLAKGNKKLRLGIFGT